MPFHEVIDGLIPSSPICPHARRVPPIRVELPISKCRDLSQSIQKTLKKSKKTCKPTDERNGRQLHQSFKYRNNIERCHLVEAVPQHRGGVLSASYPNENTQAKNFCHAYSNEQPSNFLGTWVYGLIHQRWCPPKVRQVLQSNVFRVRALIIDLWQRIFFPL